MRSRILVIHENPQVCCLLLSAINNSLHLMNFSQVLVADATGDVTIANNERISGLDGALAQIPAEVLREPIFIQPSSISPPTGAKYLEKRYGSGNSSEHPVHTRYKWRRNVGNQQTSLGYWEWVDKRINNRKEVA